MHHYLPKPEWLDDVNERMVDLGPVKRYMNFDTDFVLVENDWATGREPEDVAEEIHTGKHKHATRTEFFNN